MMIPVSCFYDFSDVGAFGTIVTSGTLNTFINLIIANVAFLRGDKLNSTFFDLQFRPEIISFRKACFPYFLWFLRIHKNPLIV